MPHVLEDPNILEEHRVLSPERDTLDMLPCGLPASRGKPSTLLARLAHLFTPTPRLLPHRQAPSVPGTRRFEAPLDILAREYPDVHLWAISGIG